MSIHFMYYISEMRFLALFSLAAITARVVVVERAEFYFPNARGDKRMASYKYQVLGVEA